MLVLGGKIGVSRALFHPKIASKSNFDLESRLVLCTGLAAASVANSNLVWCSHNLSLSCLFAKLAVCTYFVTNLRSNY